MFSKISFIFLFLMAVFQAGAQTTISGKITDKLTGESLPGVAVFVRELQKGVTTDDKGNYRLKNLPKGHFQLEYRLLGYDNISRHVDINGQKEIKLDMMLEQKAIVTPEVTITAVGFGQQHNNAIRVDLIKAGAIRQSAAAGAMQKLKTIPGVDIVSRGPGIGTPVIRGLSLVNILALNNGVRIENFQFSANHPFLIDDYGVERVEVIKGPASVLYGANAVGGVINFIREKPAPVGKTQSDINLGWNSASQGFTTNVGVKHSGESFYWGVRGGMQSFADYRQPDKSTVPNSRFSRQNAQLMTGFHRKKAAFNFYYDYMHFTPSMVVPPAHYDSVISGPGRKNEDWYQNLDYHLAAARTSWFLGDHKMDINLSYQRNHRRLTANKEQEVDMLLQAADYEIKDRWNNRDRIIVAGGLQGNISINKNGEAPEHVVPDYTQNQHSAFVFGQYKPLKTISFQAGARFDFTAIDVPEQQEEGEWRPALQRTYSTFNYSLGATWNITDKLLLRANFAKAFRNPSVAELTQDGGHGARAEFGNTNLQNQENYEGDLGLHYHNRHWVFDMAGFNNTIRHYIFLQYRPDSSWHGLPVYVYEQTDARLYGLETGIRFSQSVWDIRARYSFVKGRQHDGSVLPWIPQSKLSSQLTWKSVLCVNQKVFADLFFSGDYAFGKQEVAATESPANDWFVANAGLLFHLKGLYRSELNIMVTNLFNTPYIDFLSQLKQQGYYEQGRSLILKLSLSF